MILARMADSISVEDLPAGLPAYAGYVDGKWPTFGAVCRRFYPRAHCVSITVEGGNARICDCEAGDLTVRDAAKWTCARIPVQRGGLWTPHSYESRLIAPQWRPGPYLRASLLAEFLDAALDICPALQRSSFVVWGAHWTPELPVELPPGLDALQAENVEPANYDLTLCGPSFLAGTA